jgi:hypothetical protein
MPIQDLEARRRLDEVEAKLRAIDRMRAGDGIVVQKLGGGLVISAKPSQGGNYSATVDNSGGTQMVLAQTQGAADDDTWNRTSDKCPVAVQVLTDFKYDAVAHTLTFRTRTFAYDKGGCLEDIGPENDLVTIETAVPDTD